MPGGRPTLYQPEFCEMLVDHMDQGYSFESFAADVDVDRDTLYEWAKVHPQFSDAKKRGFAKSLKFLEKAGLDSIFDCAGFNTTLYIFTMKSRFKMWDRPVLEPSASLPADNAERLKILSDFAVTIKPDELE